MNYELGPVAIDKLEKQTADLETKHLHKVQAVQAPKGVKEKAFDPGSLLAAICGAIAIATPVLKIVQKLPFIGKKAKAAIKRIFDTIALACPTE